MVAHHGHGAESRSLARRGAAARLAFRPRPLSPAPSPALFSSAMALAVGPELACTQSRSDIGAGECVVVCRLHGCMLPSWPDTWRWARMPHEACMQAYCAAS